MHLKMNNINKGILPLIFIVGLFKITGIEAVENQKGSSDSKQADYDYNEDTSADISASGETSAPKSTIKPYFESNINTVYASKEGENITVTCNPKNFNDSRHQILWYKDEHPISNGNTSLSAEKYAVDNTFHLTIFNYNKTTAGNFSCGVLPSDIHQYVVIEFNAPPDSITKNGASAIKYFGLGLMLSALSLIKSSIY